MTLFSEKQTLTIITNNQSRNLLSYNELTPKEQEQFDYLTDDFKSSEDYIRYRNYVYALSDFENNIHNPELKGWIGHMNDSYFSGICIKYGNNKDQIICGTYYS
jgi:hypothetical protein